MDWRDDFQIEALVGGEWVPLFGTDTAAEGPRSITPEEYVRLASELTDIPLRVREGKEK